MRVSKEVSARLSSWMWGVFIHTDHKSGWLHELTAAQYRHRCAPVTCVCLPSPRSQSPLRPQRCLSCWEMLGHETRPGTTGAPSPSGTVEERENDSGRREDRSPLKTTPLRLQREAQSRLVYVFLRRFLSNCHRRLQAQLSLHPAVVSLPSAAAAGSLCGDGPWTVRLQSLRI